MGVGAWGNSLTEPSNGWADLTRLWLDQNYPAYLQTWDNQAISGHWPWSNNIRANAEILSASKDLILCDFRPTNTGREMEAAEAIIRRIWTANPTARIISPIFPSSSDMINVSALSATELAANALATYYDIPLIDYRQAVIDLVAGGALLTTYLADTIHPTAAGHALCASLVEAYLQANPGFTITSANHYTLPARQYDNGDYEASPTRLYGTAYTSRTGAGWTDTGTRTENSTEGDTITFTATCKSFGLYSAGTANSVADVQIDGGEWQTNRTISHNGYDQDISLAPHTITIRVRAGSAIRIDEFWAI